MALRSALVVQGGRELGYDEVTAPQLDVVAADVTGLSITKTLVAGRRIRIHGHVPLELESDASTAFVFIRQDGVNVASIFLGPSSDPPAGYFSGDIWHEFTSVAGTFTWTMRVEADPSALRVDSSDLNPSYLTVDDMGPA